MKYILLLFTLISFSLTLSAQISHGGEPQDWEIKDADRFSSEGISFPELEMELIRAQDEISDQYKDTPYRFGIEHEVDVDITEEGTASVNTDESITYRYAVNCENAYSLAFHFNEYSLEKGAELFIWNKERTQFLGSFTHNNNKSHGELPISIINTSSAVIEYTVPSIDKKGRLNLSLIVQGYRGITNKFHEERGPYGNSGNCNININCPEGDEWQVEKNSVALILNGGFASCTGALVNNTANNGIPYFLTADHCLGNPQNWTYLFNHESETCNGNDGPTFQTIATGDLRASNSGSDFALIELSQTPPASYNVQYCGWDRSDAETVTGTAGIHHPAGDLMKICIDEDAPYHANQGGAAVWYIDEWEDGVTEGGSSGSPLFDQNHRIIGQLYGGFAACSGNVNNGQADWYGRFGVSWDGSSPITRLKDWLDPLNIAPVTWDGFPIGSTVYENDASIAITTEIDGVLCGSNLYPGVNLANQGSEPLTSATIEVVFNGGVTQVVEWTGDLSTFDVEFIPLDLQPVAQGNNVMTISVSNVNQTEDESLSDNTSQLEFVAVTENPSVFQVKLVLDEYGSETSWEIRDDQDLWANGGPYQDDVEGQEINTDVCLPEGCFDFIILDEYGDGMCCEFGDGSYSVVNQNNVEVAAGGEFTETETTEICATITGLEELGAESLLLFPNPAADEINISIPTDGAELTIIDLAGKTVYKKNDMAYGLAAIEIADLAKGMYLVQLSVNGEFSRATFIKE